MELQYLILLKKKSSTFKTLIELKKSIERELSVVKKTNYATTLMEDLDLNSNWSKILERYIREVSNAPPHASGECLCEKCRVIEKKVHSKCI